MEISNFKVETIYRPIENNLQETPLSKVKTWPISKGEITTGGIYYRKDKQSVLSKVVEYGFNKRLEEKSKLKIQYWREQGITDKVQLLKKCNMTSDEFDKFSDDIDEEGNMHSSFYDRSQHRWKIRINSLYGALGNEYFHLFNIDNARCITLSGQNLIKYMCKTFNGYFKNQFYKNKKYFEIEDKSNMINKDVVRLIDTDSVVENTNIDVNILGVKSEGYIKDIYKMGINEKEVAGRFYRTFAKDVPLKAKTFDGEKDTYELIKMIVKHKVKKRFFKIKVENKEVIVTEDESIIVKRNKDIISIKVKDIQDNDEMIIQ